MAAAICIPGDCCTTTVTTIPGPMGPGSGSSNAIAGTVAIGNLSEAGNVVGLALSSVPISVNLTVQSPSGGLVMFATVVGTPTVDGFAWQLSGLTDATGYVLHYQIFL